MKLRKNKTISKEDIILQMLLNKELEVDLITAEVKREGKISKAFVGSNSRYILQFRIASRNRLQIVRSRLVYIAGTMKLIPDNFVIHHVDNDRYNDCFSNLIAVTKEDHLKLHGQFRLPSEGVPF